MSPSTPLRIGIVAGEESGDTLGAGLMRALKALCGDDIIFEGVGGMQMVEEGFNSLFPQDRLAVMGLFEPLKRLPELISIRRQLNEHFLTHRPQVFIGIDSPDFNLGLEEKLKGAGISTVHYVSPSVWAWRRGRIKKIRRAVDLMLTLFPFEADFYHRHQVTVEFVGHPLAEKVPLEPDVVSARGELGLSKVLHEKKVVAILPGSRAAEVSSLGNIFLATADLCLKKDPNLHFLIPAANEQRHAQLEQLVRDYNLPVTLIAGQSRTVMQAADAVLLASGTSTLEAMLLKKPMVIAYKLSRLTFAIVSRLAYIKHVGLPNLLAGKLLVPEFLQENVTPLNLSDALLQFLHDPIKSDALKQEFSFIHQSLRKNADELAARAIQQLMSVGDDIK